MKNLGVSRGEAFGQKYWEKIENLSSECFTCTGVRSQEWNRE
jgi:hypothetical protein